MMSEAIRVRNVSKKYSRNLNLAIKYGAVDLGRNLLGLELGSKRLRTGEFWALEGVDFKINPGEVVGIVGRNGSGKSTLLKLINGIFLPDTGEVAVRGRVGALIEVGAGFHPMLTGRENIFINGAIMGMTQKEIRNKFDQIVEFADIGEFLDSPVKTYSSGMYVRLGFSVAVFSKPDVLLIDEVLAVGDLAFALKCHRKMSELRDEGITQVIVTHNTQAIRNMCKKVLWLDRGKVKAYGDTSEVIDQYEEFMQADNTPPTDAIKQRLTYDEQAVITNVKFGGQKVGKFSVGRSFNMDIEYDFGRRVKRPIFAVTIYNGLGQVISSNYSNYDGAVWEVLEGRGSVGFEIERVGYNPGNYVITVSVSEGEVAKLLDVREKEFVFQVNPGRVSFGMVNPFPVWKLETKGGGK